MRTVWVYLDGYGKSTETIYYNEPPKKEYVPSEKRYLFDELSLRKILLEAMRERGAQVGASHPDDWIGWTSHTIQKLISEAAN